MHWYILYQLTHLLSTACAKKDLYASLGWYKNLWSGTEVGLVHLGVQCLSIIVGLANLLLSARHETPV